MMLISAQLLAQPRRKEHVVEHPTFYRTVQVGGLSIFYREAGPKTAPTILLLHGLPSSSRMPQLTGAELLTRAAKIKPEAVRILLTGFSDIEAVVEALNKGKLYQYVSKPFEPESFLRLLGQATAAFSLVHERREMIEELQTLNDGRSPAAIDAARVAEENESLARDNQVLRTTIANFQDSYWCVRRFQEVLPICMTCSKVRLGANDWMELAASMRQHSDFLSHSYCPECAELAMQSIRTGL